MSKRIHFDYAATRYAKPTPITDGAWDSDDITGVAETFDPGSGAVATGYYTFATTLGQTYGIYEQVGASPASTDPLVYVIDEAEAAAQSADGKLPADTATKIGLIEAMRGTDNANTVEPNNSGIAAAKTAAEQAAANSGTSIAIPQLERGIGDERPIDILWPTEGETLTGTVHVAGTDPAGATALDATITELTDEPADASGEHWYRIPYDVDDRFATPVNLVYTITDGTVTRTYPLAILPDSATAITEDDGGGAGIATVISPAQRSINETRPIDVSWPSDSATLTGQVHDAGQAIGDASPLQGLISRLVDEPQNELGEYWYRIAYNADDRSPTPKNLVYIITDGSLTRTYPIEITPAGGNDALALAILQEVTN